MSPEILFSFRRLAAELGEEVADERVLRGGVSRQLSDVRVVALVGLFADLRAGG